MNNFQKVTTKTIALFLSLGMMSSLVACNPGETDSEDDGASTEQSAPNQDEGGEGEGGESVEGGDEADEADEGGEGGEGGEEG